MAIKAFGIPIKFSLSAWFLVALVAFYGYASLLSFGVTGAVHLITGTILIVVGIISSIVFHELTHALTARRYAIGTSEIAIWGLGGTSFLKGKYLRPGQMFWVSFAGPLSSIVLAVIVFLIATIGALWHLNTGAPGIYFGLIYLFITNLVLAVFNLFPALPLDGGGVLQSILWKLNGNQNKAGLWAAYVGVVLSVALGFYAVFFLHAFFLAIVSLFVFFTAWSEVRWYRGLLNGSIKE